MHGAKNIAILIFVASCALLTSCEPPNPWITVFSDDFGRADGDPGNGWALISEAGSPAPSALISGNELVLTGGDTSHVCAMLSRAALLAGDFRVTFDFRFPGALTYIYLYVVEADADRYAVGFQPGSLGIFKNGAGIGDVGLTLDPVDGFSLEVVREGAELTVTLRDTASDEIWEHSVTDDSFHDFTSINLWGGYYDTAATLVAVDDFVLQAR